MTIKPKASSNGSEVVSPLSSADLMGDSPLREFIMLAGKDGVGKSCALVSLAWYVEQLDPGKRFFVIDTENKFRSAMKGFGSDAPKNIVYYKTDTMNQVTSITAEILNEHQQGDWLGVESMSRVWERSQNMGYEAIAGIGKAEYMERRRAQAGKKDPVTPKPDELWSIVKGAHDGAFLDLLTQSETLNVCMTTIVSKPPKPDAFIKENADRKALRAELGIDMGLEGSPRLPYYVETLCLLDLKGGRVSCRVLRDNLSTLESSRVEFDVEGKRTWAIDFWSNCRS